MKPVTIFDSFITAIRETRFRRDEATAIMEELRTAYPEVFDRSGIDSGQFPSEFNERRRHDANYRGHFIDAESQDSEDLEEL